MNHYIFPNYKTSILFIQFVSEASFIVNNCIMVFAKPLGSNGIGHAIQRPFVTVGKKFGGQRTSRNVREAVCTTPFKTME